MVLSVVDEELDAVPVSPDADDPVPPGGVAETEPEADPEIEGELPLAEGELVDGEVPLADEALDPVSVPPVVEGDVVAAEDELLGDVGALEVGGGVVVVELDELEAGGCVLGGVPRLSLLSQAANPRRHADTATISFMMLSFFE